MAKMTPEEMDELNNPDNNLLDMHLGLDHVCSHLVYGDVTNKFNEPNDFSPLVFKKILINNYKKTINGWNSVYFINHDYIRPVSLIANN